MHPVIAGSLKSKTIWAAALILLASNLQPLWPEIGAALRLDPKTWQLIGSVIAVIMGTLRTVTNGSLADKVTSTDAPAIPPAAVPVLLMAALLPAILLSGCASIQGFFGSPAAAPVITAAVDVAVATAEQKGITAAQINRVCKVALAADGGTTATLAAVSGAVNTQIAKLGLPAADMAAAQILEVAVSAAIAAKVGNSATLAAAQTDVATVLNAVITATGG